MLTIEAAGTRVAQELEATETAINEALRCVARLQGAMINARMDTGLAQYEGQPALARVGQANSALMESMNHVLRAHKGVRADFERVSAGLEDGDRCPLPKKTALADTQVA